MCCEKPCAADLDWTLCPISFLTANHLRRVFMARVAPLNNLETPMATLKIYAADGVDDPARCIIALVDDGQDLLKSTKLMTPAVAGANAKALKFKGPSDEWSIDKESGSSTVHFKPIADTPFEIFNKLKIVQSALRDADIVWDPPELNPAAETADQDTTPTQGIDGS